MKKALLLDMIEYFAGKNLIQGDGIDAFRDFSPEEPDNAIILYEYKGDPILFYEEAVNRSVQVTVRNKSASKAKELAQTLFNALRSENLIVQFSPDRWGQVHLRQTPFLLKRDNNNRTVYAFNIGVTTTVD